MDELLEQFLIEAPEFVQEATDGLLALEDDHADLTSIDSAFRAVHTLKGSVGLFDFAPMGAALHAAEELLEAIRARRLAANRSVISVLLECIAACDRWIQFIAKEGVLPPEAGAESRRITANLGEAFHGRVDPPLEGSPDEAWIAALITREAKALASWRGEGPVIAVRYMPERECFFRNDDPLARVRSVPGLLAMRVEGRNPWSVEGYDPYACDLVIELLSTAPIAEVRRLFPVTGEAVVVEADVRSVVASGAGAGVQGNTAAEAAATPMLRVDARRVDALVDIVGELIVAKNALAHLASRALDHDIALARELAANQATINRITGDMHRGLMSLRMVPLRRTFRRFPRLVRDIAERLGKQVKFEMEGEDIEADKGIVDGLFEPLLHVLRNALDHGIEAPQVRERTSKPAQGRLTLSASRDGEQICITVADDGAGIDLAKLRGAAKSAGLRSGAAIDAMDDKSALELVFAPGLSTAAGVTDLSGRGVGMDAVRTAVEAAGGRAFIESVIGEGTTVRLVLPQAVVITTVMLVKVGSDVFGVPIDAVIETARLPCERIIPIRSGAAFVLRDRTVPLVQLASLLGAAQRQAEVSDARVLIVAMGEERIGVQVDNVAERIDVLLRPMTGLLAGMQGILGTALLGDGRVLMVLDLPELVG